MVYLKPFVTREYPASSYARLQDPQDASITQTGEWTWIAGESIENAMLEQVKNGRILDQVPLQAYTVKQNPGGELGYEIVEYDSQTPSDTPRIDFVGFRVPLEDDNRNFSVQLRSPDESLLIGSTRAVRVAKSNSAIQLGAISLFPLLIGAAILWWRQQQISRVKSEGTT